MYSSHATTRFNLGVIVPTSYDEYTALVKSGNVASKHVKRMKSAIETSDLKLSEWSWYKRPRIVMRSMSERSTLQQQISTSVGTKLEGVVGTYSGGNLGYRDLLGLCDVPSGRVIGILLFCLQHA